MIPQPALTHNDRFQPAVHDSLDTRRVGMVVGVLQVEITIDWATSLKDKRSVVSSLKDRLHREHQVSVAEVDALDNRRVAVLGITLASNSVSHCQGMIDRVLKKINNARDSVVSDHRVEILSGN